MKILKKVILWPISIFMLLSALVYFPSLASVMMVLTSALTLPIDNWQKLLDKIVRKKFKIVLAVVFALISFVIAPVENVPDDVVNNNTSTTEASSESTTIPKLEVEDTVATTEATVEIETTTAPSEQPPVPTTEAAPTTEPHTEPPTVETTAPPDLYDYDSLQTIFLAVIPETTIEEIEAFIVEYELCYTRKEYNKSGGGKSVSYKIAYTDGAAKQSHAEPGDYLDVDFDKANGALMTAQYSKSGTVGSALLYCYGTWFDFRDSNAEDYSGYYLIDALSKKEGIKIKYDNGYEVQTHYFSYPSAEELIQYIINIEE